MMAAGDISKVHADELCQVRGILGDWFYTKVPKMEHEHINPEWCELDWFIVRTISKPQPPRAPRLDQLVKAELMALGHPVIMPVANKRVRERLANGRTGKGLDDMPKLLVPGYVFMGVALKDYAGITQILNAVSQSRHVAGYVAQGDKPVCMPKAEMRRFINNLNDGLYDESRGNLNKDDSPILGEMATITDGPLQLVSGLVEEFATSNDPLKPLFTHAFVRIDILGGERRVKIPIDSIVKSE